MKRMVEIEFDVKVDLKGIKDLEAKLKDGTLLSDVTYAGATVGSMNARRGIEVGRPEWKPLAPATVMRKGHGKILWETGAMHDSIHAERRGPDAAYGSDRLYSDNHELGIGVPRRAFLEPTTAGEEKDQMIAACEAVVAKAVDEANKK